ncbi:hypothetical protein P9272_16755 [Mesorhizobium sp. WSM4976]|uniref:hypothetical protein n=1 Tax=Mesorhizobium sp. WSM4976 TaxID=3038549 RepID=UPI002417BE55|nr:hypothetical protein [Mesorhizobium sp. WSM4976]MDG4895221.1 hypothetical protein [Mesorhizobium sp. WSM4976]
MRSLWIALLAGNLSSAATLLCAASAAHARPDTRAMTCAETQALIKLDHAVVLTTGPDTYDRFVRQFGNECDWPEVPISTAVPAKDGECGLYRCEEPVDLPD